ncbi:hypothetical protein O181_013792 [Austropuccinia psidii MF-1]|uniref:mitochondrial intermediate peptidase n=1 Tax=Austropuccinia psidii MF-1 TaxID=1389203 RepID=A0A9Q3C0F3_9BASI|nr:hypothetical protein [Austropuccinia psidii MF-1]
MAPALRLSIRPKQPQRVFCPFSFHFHSQSVGDTHLVSRFENNHEDQAIRKAFDKPWIDAGSSFSSPASVGMFGYSQLQESEDLMRIAQRTVRKCGLIVNRICRSFSPHRSPGPHDPVRNDTKLAFLKCVGMFDRLSDGLCRVIDLAELIRNLHPDPKWIDAANRCHGLLCRYMNTLNTHRDLYNALDSVLNQLPTAHQDPDLFAARAVALQFLRDFHRHGIHLPSSSLKRLVELSDRMLLLGRAFFAGSTEAQHPTHVTKPEARMMGLMFTQSLDFDSRGIAYIDPSEWEAHILLRQHPEESVRRRVWMAQNKSTDEQVSVLEALLKTRNEFARLTGKSNWGQVALEDKMARSPENVMTFLSRLATETRPLALKELSQIQEIKQTHSKDTSSQISPWDRDYYANLLNFRSQTPSSSNLAPYFSVGTCLQGLSRLFSLIYGISFRVESHHAKEVWHESVIKIGVIDEKEGRIGTIYCDLFDRENKSRGAAHYTVLCSRRTDVDDDSSDFQFLPSQAEPLIDDIYPSLSDCELLQVPITKRKGREGTYQRPIVVFSCSFDPPNPASGQPGLLAWSDVETLFHEMGHAMHSMIGQTDYHNVSGTRCPTDLVELPSILMEHFASCTSVLGLFARHYADDRPLDRKAFRDYLAHQTNFKGLETNAQIVMAALDQHYHSDIASLDEFDSTVEYHKIQDRFGLLASVPEASWQTKFGHLHGYGAGYYSYLFDRVIAGKVWQEIFESKALSRESGEKYKEEVLAWGGGRESWEGIGKLLKDPIVEMGGLAAIDRVGSWGLWKDS